jgi:hypothetical protein
MYKLQCMEKEHAQVDHKKELEARDELIALDEREAESAERA